ncbi:hypothetical protein QR680_002934 [Steinernema hermaphroditum]|uniref:Dynactin subunit 1 n=1 Tax=Steinernema hermaphroditum TaxID=289476 RepID=A0AA39LIQ7_9BILA|nr:hypothetical protein QR680_002934 [Steinernema hermaphroditum]
MPSLEIGDRVITDKSLQGKLAFYGETQFSEGIWCGIILDKPIGKNNGSVQGVKYFSCPDKFGVFVKAETVTSMEQNGSRRGSSISSTPSTSSTNLKSSIKPPTAKGGMTSSTSSEKLRPSGLKKPSSDPRIAAQPTAAEKGKRPSLIATPRSTKTPAAAPAVLKTPPEENTPRKEKEKPAETSPLKQTPVAVHVREKEKKIEEHVEVKEVKPVVFTEDMNDDAKLVYLTEQYAECQSKLDTLREKRKEDFHKLQEAENLKYRFESLQQTKMELAARVNQLTAELEETKNAAAEAIKIKQEIQDEYSDFGERLEEATIDKEIAEERCEQLQIEIKGLNLRIQELETDYDILKTEMEGSEGSEGAANSVQVKSLEEKNRRLQEGLLKMRDVANDHAVRKIEAEKELERLRTVNAELGAQAETALRGVKYKDDTIAKLQDQVDTFLGSEKMIETLTERNLNLEDQVTRLEEEVEDLESMNTVNEELFEAAKAEEKALRMEIDREIAMKNELRAVIAARDNKITELDKVIQKYRTKVEELDEQILNLNDQILVLNERIEQQAAGHEFGRSGAATITNARNFSDVVAHRIRDVEYSHSQRHVKLLRSFLPDNFNKPGGDNDSLLINVALPRMAEKLTLLIDLVAQQYPMVPGGMRREHVTKAHRAEQWVFAAHLNFEAKGLITILKKCDSALQSCSVERLAKIAPMQMEIATQERAIDCFLELLRTGRLDENVSLDPMSRCTLFFQNLFTLNLAGDSFDTNTNMSLLLDQLIAGIVWIKRNLERLPLFLSPSEDASEIKPLVSTLAAEAEEIEQLALKAKSRLPEQPKVVNTEAQQTQTVLTFTSGFLESVDYAHIALIRFGNLVHTLCSSASTQIHVLTDVDGLTVKQLKEMVRSAVEKGVGQMDEEKALESFKAASKRVLENVQTVFKALDGRKMEEQKPAQRNYPPLFDRAHARKQDAAEAEGLRWQIEKKDAENMELRTTIRSKNEDLSTLRLRLELADKKVDSAGKMDEARCQRLQQKVDDLMTDMTRMKTDYERALDLLQHDLDLLEKENADLKNKSRSISKKSVQDSSQPGSPTVTSVIHPLVMKELEQVKSDLKWSNYRLRKIQGKTTRQLLDEMPELHLPNVVSGVYGLKEKRRDDIEMEVEHLRKELLNLDLESQSLRLTVGPTKQKDKELHSAMVAEYNSRCEDIKFRCARLWKKCRPGEALPVQLDMSDAPKIDDTTAEDILSKWEQEVKENSPAFVTGKA